MTTIAWAMSENRWKVKLRDILVRLAIQFILADFADYCKVPIVDPSKNEGETK
ncbi:MAG: hypothetical protein E3K36_09930 [Candidatus Brocadia sp.]|nr:hypothetical protein [Candidatus Brocadia sp.]